MKITYKLNTPKRLSVKLVQIGEPLNVKLERLNQKREEYVVAGASVICSCGNKSSNMVFPARGYIVGYGNIGLSTDTGRSSFSGDFGICRCTQEPCSMSLVKTWRECAKEQSIFNANPLLMKSMIVCKRGGYLSFKSNGQREKGAKS